MSLPNLPFAGQTAPTMSELDGTFNAVAALGIVPCTASGTNIITLTPNANTPTISAYANYLQFSFVVVNTTTGAVTLKVGSLAALNVYLPDGTTQAANGTLQINFLYVVAFNSALNSGGGGFVIVSAQVSQTQSIIASSSTVAIGAAATDYITISGTQAITAFDNVIAGTRRVLTFSSSATLTNSTALILLGGTNITTAPGHTAIVESEGSGNWRFITYFPVSSSFKQSTLTTLTVASVSPYTPPTGSVRLVVEAWGGGGSGGGGDGGTHRGIGGAGGGYCKKTFTAPLAASYVFTIGSGGGSVNQAVAGNSGGGTTFGGVLTAGGGGGGAAASGGGQGGTPGGLASGGDESIVGGQSYSNGDGTTAFVSWGGDSPRGGLGAKINVNNGGGAPGGGSSAGNATGASAGTGANGAIVIQEFYY